MARVAGRRRSPAGTAEPLPARPRSPAVPLPGGAGAEAGAGGCGGTRGSVPGAKPAAKTPSARSRRGHCYGSGSRGC